MDVGSRSPSVVVAFLSFAFSQFSTKLKQKKAHASLCFGRAILIDDIMTLDTF